MEIRRRRQKEDMDMISNAVAMHGDANIVILGRGRDAQAVEHWLVIGASAHNSIGFAVGRTIFSDAITSYVNKKYDEAEAVERIAENLCVFFMCGYRPKIR